MNTPEHERGIEAAARAIYDTQENGVPWDGETLGDWRKDYEREKARNAIAAYLRERTDLVEPEALREAAIRLMPPPFVAALDHLLEREFGADHAARGR